MPPKIEVLNCPLCDYRAEAMYDDNSDYAGHFHWIIECQNDKCNLHISGESGVKDCQPLIGQWNTRATKSPPSQNGWIDELTGKLSMRERDITEFLKDCHYDVTAEQAHLDATSPERAYWHYGYLMAIKDVLKQLPQPPIKGE